MNRSRSTSNSSTPCSMIESEESSQPTFMRAFSTRERGWSWPFRTSAGGVGLWASERSPESMALSAEPFRAPFDPGVFITGRAFLARVPLPPGVPGVPLV